MPLPGGVGAPRDDTGGQAQADIISDATKAYCRLHDSIMTRPLTYSLNHGNCKLKQSSRFMKLLIEQNGGRGTDTERRQEKGAEAAEKP